MVGLEEDTWGESVVAVTVLNKSESLELEELRTWSRDRLSTYKIPKQLLSVKSLPRNVMGKITKSALKDLFQVR